VSGADRDVPPEEIRSAEHPAARDVDVLALHRQALREAQEPGEGTEAGPWWFWAAAVLALVVGGFYLGRYSGTFAGGAGSVHAVVGSRAPGAGSVAAGPAAEVGGQAVFEGRCAACHQTTGQGLPGAFPPLVGSEYVTGDVARLARIVLHGLQGPVEVGGQSFNGAMPAWADLLSDAEIAAVLTYVRSSWGNAAEAVSADAVAQERSATAGRTAPWTVGELAR